MVKFLAGFDIGGTKCAVILGKIQDDQLPEIIAKEQFATANFPSPYDCIDQMLERLQLLQKKYPNCQPEAIGISCGGPLDPNRGIIQSPPNLPGWDNIPICQIVNKKTNLPTRLQNDANACGLAEWKFGAGKGTQNMVFLTFGTGLGAGIIVNGKILNGASGMGGECGHIRLADNGPVGYHKAGSFEGFCSGGGLAQIIQQRAKQAILDGKPFAWCQNNDIVNTLNAKIVADAANNGDLDAIAIYEDCGKHLGQGLAILVDILNPERIVIGSIFTRSENLLRPAMEKVMQQEALPESFRACKVVPALLGEQIGDIAALTTAISD